MNIVCNCECVLYGEKIPPKMHRCGKHIGQNTHMRFYYISKQPCQKENDWSLWHLKLCWNSFSGWNNYSRRKSSLTKYEMPNLDAKFLPSGITIFGRLEVFLIFCSDKALNVTVDLSNGYDLVAWIAEFSIGQVLISLSFHFDKMRRTPAVAYAKEIQSI